MRKLILIATAIAVLAVPAAASAKVERCQVTTTVAGASVTTAKFTVMEPAGTKTDFSNVYSTDYTVTVNDDKTFAGTGLLNGGGAVNVPTTITGTLNSDGTMSYVAIPVGAHDGVKWTADNAVTDGTTVNDQTSWGMEPQTGPSVRTYVKVTQPVLDTVKGQDTVTTTEYKNHGEYVSAMGGGKVAAQECIGMPVNSTQGK